MLRWRLLSASIIIAIAVGSAYLDYRAALGAPPGLWMLPLFIAAVFLGTKEMLDLLAAGGYRPTRWPVYVGTLAVALTGCNRLAFLACDLFETNLSLTSQQILAKYVVWLTGRSDVLACMSLFVVAIEIRRFDNSRQHLQNIIATLFIVVYLGFLMSFLAELRFFNDTLVPLLSTIAIVKSSDAGAYFTGRFLGRNKFSPLLSPKKTWEGTVGGVATSGIVSLLFFVWIAPVIDPEYSLHQELGVYVAYGCALGIVGIVGDLAISLIKREMERKDSSNLLPGLGGVLDIIDSLLPAAVLADACWWVRIVG